MLSDTTTTTTKEMAVTSGPRPKWFRWPNWLLVTAGVALVTGAASIWNGESVSWQRLFAAVTGETPNSERLASLSGPSPTVSSSQADEPDGPRKPPVEPSAGQRTSGSPEGRVSDDRRRELLVGTWEQFHHGRRRLTVRGDGTATMVVHPDGIWQHVFGKTLRFEIAWRIDEDRLVFETTGGAPQAQVDLVTKMYGRKRKQPIVHLSESRLVLRDPDDGQPSPDWKRIDPSSAE